MVSVRVVGVCVCELRPVAIVLFYALSPMAVLFAHEAIADLAGLLVVPQQLAQVEYYSTVACL